MTDPVRRLSLRLGDFAIAAEGFEDPARPIRMLLRSVQQTLEETPEFAKVSIALDDEVVTKLLERLQRADGESGASFEAVPGLVLLRHEPETAEESTEQTTEQPVVPLIVEAPDETVVEDIVGEISEPVADCPQEIAEDPAVLSEPETDPMTEALVAEPEPLEEPQPDQQREPEVEPEPDLGPETAEAPAPIAETAPIFGRHDVPMPDSAPQPDAAPDEVEAPVEEITDPEPALETLAEPPSEGLASEEEPDVSAGDPAPEPEPEPQEDAAPPHLEMIPKDIFAAIQRQKSLKEAEASEAEQTEAEAPEPEPATAMEAVTAPEPEFTPEPASEPEIAEEPAPALEPEQEPETIAEAVTEDLRDQAFETAPEAAPEAVPDTGQNAVEMVPEAPATPINIFAPPPGQAETAPKELAQATATEIHPGAAPDPAAPINIFAPPPGASDAPSAEATNAASPPASEAAVRNPSSIFTAPGGAAPGGSRQDELETSYRSSTMMGAPGDPSVGETGGDTSKDREIEPGDLATASGAESVPELLTASAAYLTLVKDQNRFTRREVMTIFDALPGAHPRSLEARIKGYGKLVRNGQLVLVGDGLFALSQEERDRHSAALNRV
ncbi:MAG: hypothetical protein AAGI13_07260 [Pseudomonadota bacterium]